MANVFFVQPMFRSSLITEIWLALYLIYELKNLHLHYVLNDNQQEQHQQVEYYH